MRLLERGYKTATIADLDRNIRKLEEKKKKAKEETEEKAELEQIAAEMEIILSFAERVGLINAMQAATYRHRILAIRHEVERREVEAHHNVLSGGGQDERRAKWQNMAAYEAQIQKQREEIEAKKREQAEAEAEARRKAETHAHGTPGQ